MKRLSKYLMSKRWFINFIKLSLPTNDEIVNYHSSLKDIDGNKLKHSKDKMHRLGFYRGAIWMRDIINGIK